MLVYWELYDHLEAAHSSFLLLFVIDEYTWGTVLLLAFILVLLSLVRTRLCGCHATASVGSMYPLSRRQDLLLMASPGGTHSRLKSRQKPHMLKFVVGLCSQGACECQHLPM